MLSSVDQRLVRRFGVSFNHNAELLECAYGEAFLENGLLCFYDGRVLSLSAFPLLHEDSPLQARVNRTLEEWLKKAGVDLVFLFSAERVDCALLRSAGFHRKLYCVPKAIKAEMILDCSEVLAKRGTARKVRQARRQGLSLRISRRPQMRAQHLGLIEQFYEERQMTPYLLDLAVWLQSMRLLENVRWIEALDGGELCGLAAVHEAFECTDLAVFMARDRNARGVADFLVYHMAQTSRDLGRRYLNLGASPTEGHYRFKAKWGAAPLIPPYHYQVWGRDALGATGYFSWVARVIGRDCPQR